MYRLFSWEHSYFSGKVRAYLRHKQRMGALPEGFEDVLATRELLAGLLVPKSGSPAVPQLEAPDGTWVADSSAILDFVEARHPQAPVVPDPATRPRQCLATHLIESSSGACCSRLTPTGRRGGPTREPLHRRPVGCR